VKTDTGNIAAMLTDLHDTDLPAYVSTFADAVWDEHIGGAEHMTEGSAGYKLNVVDAFLYPGMVDIHDTVDSVKGDTGNILADTGTDGVVVAAGSKTGYALSGAGVDGILDEVCDLNAPPNANTLRKIVNILVAVMSAISSGGGTATRKFRDTGDTKDRVVATVDANENRTAVTLDGT
jgi:hypothetical protein